jgi:hypothetical protein
MLSTTEHTVLIEYYHNIASYLMETLGTHFIFLTIVLSTVASIIYLVLMAYIITQMDQRYFIHLHNCTDELILIPHPSYLKRSLNYLLYAIKVIVGIGLLICGLLMLVLPGQGLLTMLIGLSLLPFPGKHRIEKAILGQKSVRTSLNWIRKKAKKTPFIFD